MYPDMDTAARTPENSPALPAQKEGRTKGVKVTSAARLTDVVERISQNRY